VKVRWLWLPSVSGLFSADLFGDPGLLSRAKKSPQPSGCGDFFSQRVFLPATGFPIYRGRGFTGGAAGAMLNAPQPFGPCSNWGNEMRWSMPERGSERFPGHLVRVVKGLRHLTPAAAAVALPLTLGLVSCASPNVCPAIAWSNSLTVSLDGAVESVDMVEFCVENTCSVPAPRPAPSTSRIPGATPDADAVPSRSPQVAAPSISARTPSPFIASKADDRTWRFQLMMRTPERAVIRARSAEGQVLVEREVPLQWTRVGGSGQCGGPSTAAPVTLTV
jgi:hypothetical protein